MTMVASRRNLYYEYSTKDLYYEYCTKDLYHEYPNRNLYSIVIECTKDLYYEYFTSHYRDPARFCCPEVRKSATVS